MMPVPTTMHLAPFAAVLFLLVPPATAVGQQVPSVTPAGAAGPAPAAAVRSELVRDIGNVEEKFLHLAGPLRCHYDWRPGEGVRSVSEVLGHVAAANFLSPTFYGVQPPEDLRAGSRNETMRKVGGLEEVTDPDELTSALERSFALARTNGVVPPWSTTDGG